MLGLTGSDMGIRILGLGIGLFFLTSLWLCQRWIGGRTPILSIALLGGLPAFIFIVGANRALRSGQLPAGGQFRLHLACPGVSDQVANPFSWFYLPAVRPMRLFRRHLSLGNASCGSLGGNSTATVENTLGDGGHWFGSRRILVHLFADHPSGFGIPAARALALL